MTDTIKQRIEQIRLGKVPGGYIRTKAGIMPTDWKHDVRAKQLFKSHTNKGHAGKREVLAATQENGIIPRNQLDKEINYSDEGINGYKSVDKGDFIISLRPFQGGIEYSEYDGIVSPAYTVLRPTRPVSCGYYKYYFKSEDFVSRLNGAVYGIRDGKQIGYEDFGNLCIHFPPLKEQLQITEILVHCDKAIGSYRQLIDEIKRQKDYFLKNMFPRQGEKSPRIRFPNHTGPWKRHKLRDLGTITTGSTPSTSVPAYYSDDGIVWITPTDIRENITFNSAKKLSKSGQLVGRVVPKNTILVTCIASIGKNTMLGNTGSFNQQINGLTPNENEYDPYFLLTESFLWSAKMKKLAAVGTIQIVNRTEFSELEAWIPTLSEQRQIGSFFHALDDLIALHQQKLDAMQKMKKSLMQLLLTGIVRVNT